MNFFDHPYEAQAGGMDFPIPDEILLGSRLCDLKVRLEQTNYAVHAASLKQELVRAGFEHLNLQFYLADEWFCPAGSTAIAIPFWLAHPRLQQLEQTLIGYVEGQSEKEFMQLLRHETGHCIDHAYRLSSRRDWRDVFGNPKREYQPENYVWQPKSRDYVDHLPDGYAQSHPEEDFAETFAVWLDPRSRWQQRYRNWEGALAKLRYVDQLVKTIANVKPRKRKAPLICSANRTRKTLRQIYEARLKELHAVHQKSATARQVFDA